MLLSPELTLAQDPARAVVLRFDDIFIFIIFLAWLAKISVFRELGLLKKTVLNIPIRNYIFVCIFATVIGFFMGRQPSILRSFFYLLKYFEYYMLYFLVVNNIETEKETKIIVFLMIVVCFIVSCYAIYSHQLLGLRATAPFEGEQGEPNTLSGYLVVMMSLCMGLFFYQKTGKRLKICLLLTSAAAFMALLFSLSRGGWVSFVFMYIAMIVLAARHRISLVLTAVAVVLLLTVMPPPEVKERLSATFTPGHKTQTYKLMGRRLTIDESGSYRIASLKFGFQQLMDSPLFGHGVPTLALVDTQLTRIMMETGVLGLVFFGIILVRIVKTALHVLEKGRRTGDGFAHGLAVGYIAAFVGLIAHSFSAATFIIIRIMEPFWMLTAVIVSLPDMLVEKKEPETGDYSGT